MNNKKNNREQGVSILEILLALSVAGVLMVMSLRYYQQYRWTSSVTQIQENVTTLLQAADVYYYADCKQFTPTEQIDLDCNTLTATGAFASKKNCEAAKYNPWGNKFSVAIVGSDNFYQLQVEGDFSRYPGVITQLATLLDATVVNQTNLMWMLLPNMSLSHTSVAVRSSGGWSPLLNGTGLIMQPMNSAFWVMKGDLQLFTNSQVQAINAQNGPVTVSSCDTYRNVQ